MPRSKYQISLRALLLIVVEVAIVFGAYANSPTIAGFGVSLSRNFFLTCFIAAFVGSAMIALCKYRIVSFISTQSVFVATAISLWIGYACLYVHANQMSKEAAWPGMAAIYMFPASFLLSFTAALIVGAILPLRRFERLMCRSEACHAQKEDRPL